MSTTANYRSETSMAAKLTVLWTHQDNISYISQYYLVNIHFETGKHTF